MKALERICFDFEELSALSDAVTLLQAFYIRQGLDATPLGKLQEKIDERLISIVKL